MTVIRGTYRETSSENELRRRRAKEVYRTLKLSRRFFEQRLGRDPWATISRFASEIVRPARPPRVATYADDDDSDAELRRILDDNEALHDANPWMYRA